MQLESDFNTNDIDNKESLEKDMSLSLNELKDREKEVLEMHFGLNGNHPKSLDEIPQIRNRVADQLKSLAGAIENDARVRAEQ